MEKTLKGENFLNRYRFTGILTTRSPLHIGTGEESESIYSNQEHERLKNELGKVPQVSTIIKDYRGKPLIPGSTLRGVMRHWLLSVLSGFDASWAATRDYLDDAWTELNQADQVKAVKESFSWLELLFGTPFHEGKIEIWDATCQTTSINATDTLLGWNPKSLTYIDTSVAINPKTGTAIENLLYKTEIVPPGVEFEFNLVGQNLSEFEIGMVLLALQGFNSTIYPIRVGARSGRGYGLMQFTAGTVYGLDTKNIREWITSTVRSFGKERAADESTDGRDAAGYFALPELEKNDQERLIQTAKNKFLEQAGSHV